MINFREDFPNSEFEFLTDVTGEIAVHRKDGYTISVQPATISQSTGEYDEIQVQINVYEKGDHPPDGFVLYSEKHIAYNEENFATIAEHVKDIGTKIEEVNWTKCEGCGMLANGNLTRTEPLSFLDTDWLRVSQEQMGEEYCFVVTGHPKARLKLFTHYTGNPLFSDEELDAVETLDSSGFEGEASVELPSKQ